MDNTVFPITHVELTSAEKAMHTKVMSKGNKVLVKWHCRVQTASGQKHYNRAKFRGELFTRLNGMVRPIDMYGVTIPKEDVGVILAVRNCEMPMLAAHAKLTEKLARKAHKMNPDCNLDLDDFFNEALVAAIHAFYCYTNEKIIFSTYVVHSVRRRLMNFAFENKPMSRWGYEAYKLLVRLDAARGKINGPATFDELVRIEKFKPEEIRTVAALMTKVVNESNIVGNDHGEENSDYSQLAIDANKVEEQTFGFDEVDAVQQAISDADLTVWEKTVLEAFFASPDDHGWKTEVAQNNVNPMTGKTYSRQAPIVAMDRIKEKVQKQLEKRAAVA